MLRQRQKRWVRVVDRAARLYWNAKGKFVEARKRKDRWGFERCETPSIPFERIENTTIEAPSSCPFNPSPIGVHGEIRRRDRFPSAHERSLDLFGPSPEAGKGRNLLGKGA